MILCVYLTICFFALDGNLVKSLLNIKWTTLVQNLEFMFQDVWLSDGPYVFIYTSWFANIWCIFTSQNMFFLKYLS